jgi:pseudaminic acid cytidylyltransferase
MKPICIIPARAGSKRIKNKNIKKFNGKPMIKYSIDAAIKSKCFSKIIVSTDSIKIKKIAEKCGAEVPFIRPKKLSGDKIALRPVVINVLKFFQNLKMLPMHVCYITATAPFIDPKDIKNSYKLIKKEKVNYVFSISTFDYPIQRALRINKKKKIEMVNRKFRNYRSQDLEELYHDAGQFYWGKSSSILKDVKTFGKSSMPYLIKRWKSIDIDTKEDWYQAELMSKYLKKK